MNKYLSIILGLVLLAGVIYFNYIYPSLWQATKTVLIGGIVCLVALIGALLILLGASELKE